MRRTVFLPVLLEALHHFTGYRHTGVGPCVDNLVIPLAFGQYAGLIVLYYLLDPLFRLVNNVLLLGRNLQIHQAEAKTRQSRVPEPLFFYPV